MGENHIGVDVSKDTLDVAAYESRRKWQFPNSETGINQLVLAIEVSGEKQEGAGFPAPSFAGDKPGGRLKIPRQKKNQV